MFAVNCEIHDKEYLVGYRSIRELQNTDHGPIAVIEAPCGHQILHNFRSDRSTPVDHLVPAPA